MSEQLPEAPAIPGVTRWRKKPVTVSAIQWTGANLDEVQEFCGGGYFGAVPPEDRDPDPDMTAEVYDKLHGTWVHVYDGQWIIRGIQGELYPCAADVFAATYEFAPESLVMPADEFAALKTVAAMANPGPLRVLPPDRWKARAEAAEAKLAAIAAHCQNPGHAYVGHLMAEHILAIIGSEEPGDDD